MFAGIGAFLSAVATAAGTMFAGYNVAEGVTKGNYGQALSGLMSFIPGVSSMQNLASKGANVTGSAIADAATPTILDTGLASASDVASSVPQAQLGASQANPLGMQFDSMPAVDTGVSSQFAQSANLPTATDFSTFTPPDTPSMFNKITTGVTDAVKDFLPTDFSTKGIMDWAGGNKDLIGIAAKLYANKMSMDALDERDKKMLEREAARRKRAGALPVFASGSAPKFSSLASSAPSIRRGTR